MDALIPINVVIADRTYRIRISPHDEQTVRGTVKQINDKLLEFKTQYAGKDMQDYVSMVILWYATHQKATEQQSDHEPALAAKLQQMEAMLETALKEP